VDRREELTESASAQLMGGGWHKWRFYDIYIYIYIYIDKPILGWFPLYIHHDSSEGEQ
jgi:hypothetical protein